MYFYSVGGERECRIPIHFIYCTYICMLSTYMGYTFASEAERLIPLSLSITRSGRVTPQREYDIQFNKQRNHDSLAARCHWGIKNAIFHVAKETELQPSTATTNQILGVSCWLPPTPTQTPETWSSYFQNWTLTLSQIANNIRYLGRGGLRTNRYWIWKERQAEAQKQIWTDPLGYYFCNIVAVSPDAQGRGVGRMLFEAVTQRADGEGRRCYLESSKDVPNVAIYQRMGFEMSLEMECRDGGDACMVCFFFFFFLFFSLVWELGFESLNLGCWLTCFLFLFSCTAWFGIRRLSDLFLLLHPVSTEYIYMFNDAYSTHA